MTKVSIIEIDLGVSIDDLIDGDVTELSKGAQEELDNAIQAQKKVQELKEKKEKESKEAQDKVTVVIAIAYDKLVEAGDNGVPVEDIKDIIGTAISTTSAFTIRMKTFLRKKGNKYTISRSKKGGKAIYKFTLFNG